MRSFRLSYPSPLSPRARQATSICCCGARRSPRTEIAFRYCRRCVDHRGAAGRRGAAAHFERQCGCGPVLLAGWIPRSPIRRISTGTTTSTSFRLPAEVPRRMPGIRLEAMSRVGRRRSGKNVLIVSGMASYRRLRPAVLAFMRMEPAFPKPLPLPMGTEGSFSPDGQSIAYQPISKWQEAWKRYVGGQTTPIWIVNLKTLDLVRVPRKNSNDSSPVWQGDAVYFLSDRSENGPGAVSCTYDLNSKRRYRRSRRTRALPTSSPWQGGPGGLVYEQFGSIHFVDTASNEDKVVPIQIDGELPTLALAHRHHYSRTRSRTRICRPAGRARCLRRTAKSSPFRARRGRRRAILHADLRGGGAQSVMVAGRRRRSRTSPTPAASTSFTFRSRPASRRRW